jgi:hypothetical protein
MLPTGKDVAYMAEVGKDRIRQADEYRLASMLKEPSPLQVMLRSIQERWLESFHGEQSTVEKKPSITHGMASIDALTR